MGWFWQLHGAELLAATFGMIASAVAALYTVFRWFARFMDKQFGPHEAEKCPCYDCRRKVYRAHRKRGDQVTAVREDGSVVWDSERPPARTGWLCTADLRQNDVVGFRGTTYVVKDIHVHMLGYELTLVNVVTQSQSHVYVKFAMGKIKWWEPNSRGPL